MKLKNIKPILGCEIYVCKQDSHIKDKSNNELGHFLLLAKNLLGWRTLMNIASETNKADNFYHKPRISFNRLKEFLDGLANPDAEPSRDIDALGD